MFVWQLRCLVVEQRYDPPLPSLCPSLPNNQTFNGIVRHTPSHLQAFWLCFCQKVMEVIMFETEDLVSRKNEKHVVLTLLEVGDSHWGPWEQRQPWGSKFQRKKKWYRISYKGYQNPWSKFLSSPLSDRIYSVTGFHCRDDVMVENIRLVCLLDLTADSGVKTNAKLTPLKCY